MRSRRGAGDQRARKPSAVLDIEDARSMEVRGHRVGQLVGWFGDSPQVDFAGNPYQRLLARSTVPLSELRRELRASQQRGRPAKEVLLVFDGQHSHRPVIVGLLAEDADLGTMQSAPRAPGAPTRRLVAAGAGDDEEIILTGRRVVLEGAAEVVLRSGQASITLRRNGRLVQRGTYLESSSEGVNRIKGGSVKLN